MVISIIFHFINMILGVLYILFIISPIIMNSSEWLLAHEDNKTELSLSEQDAVDLINKIYNKMVLAIITLSIFISYNIFRFFYILLGRIGF